MADAFGLRLRDRLLDAGPLCVGIDPSRELLQTWERQDNVDGLEFFCMSVLEAVGGVAAVVKPQVGYFERFGSGGFRVLERLIHDAQDAEIMVIADAKRGDFDMTNMGYAQAWLEDNSPLAVDAVTISPYLGIDALAPFFAQAKASGRGVFVLAATSNPQGRIIQEALTSEHERIEDMVLRRVSELNEGENGYGSIGVVLGATRNPPHFDLATLDGPYLVPGVGAQGAGANDIARLFDRCREGSVVVSVSRGILQAGPERRALRDAAQRWRDDLRSAL